MVAGNILAPSQAGLMVGYAREKDGDTSQPSKAASNTPPRASHPPQHLRADDGQPPSQKWMEGEGAQSRRDLTYPDLIAADLHVADRVSLVGPAVVAAELADGHLLGFAVVQAVGVVLGAAPGPNVVRLHQEVPTGRGGLLQVGLDVGLAARSLAPQADLLGGQRRAPAAEDAVQDGGGLLQVEGVELLHDVGELQVLLQVGFLVVRLVALRTPHQARLLGPRLPDAAPAEVVLAGQLDGLHEDVQADGADELLFETVLPVLGHLCRRILATLPPLKLSVWSTDGRRGLSSLQQEVSG